MTEDKKLPWPETWKVIEIAPKYSVSNLGRVASVLTRNSPRILKPVLHKEGYYQVSLYIENRPKVFFIHRLVAMAFIPNTNNKTEINHIDCNPLNNHVDNLEWCTREENTLYMVSLNRHARGETACHKLTEKEVLEIRSLYDRKTNNRKTLGLKYGVHFMHITKIVNRRCWKHI